MCFNPNEPDNGPTEGSDAEEDSAYSDPEKVQVRFMLTGAC